MSVSSAISKRVKKKKMLSVEWYNLRSLLGYQWAIFLMLIGGREAGKSYAVTDFFVRQFVKYKRPFTWFRLTEASQLKLLNNNAEKLIDPDIKRKYNLDIYVRGNNVYSVKRDKNHKITKKVLMARVLALSTFYNDKGSGLFDKDFLNDPSMYYNIALDEMNREKNEKNSFDIIYAFANQLENVVRSTKTRVRVICIGNLLEEASDLLCAFNFIPETFGRYKLKSKRCVIDYIEPSDAYLNRRKGSIADILMGGSSVLTNKIETDTTLISKKSLRKPSYIIKFSKEKADWFTLWDGDTIASYNGEHKEAIAMLPYTDEVFIPQQRDMIINVFDQRGFKYKNLVTFKLFQKQLIFLKPRK